MASQQAACVRLVVDALLEGRFSKASVVAHMYEALQALIHDPQVQLGSLFLRKQIRSVCCTDLWPLLRVISARPPWWHTCTRRCRRSLHDPQSFGFASAPWLSLPSNALANAEGRFSKARLHTLTRRCRRSFTTHRYSFTSQAKISALTASHRASKRHLHQLVGCPCR
jgi:hypothetical protein